MPAQLARFQWIRDLALRCPSLVLALVLCAGVWVYRLYVMDAAGGPTGADPGNWLALGRELTGEKVKAAAVIYPPVVPALARSLLVFLPPLAAMNVLGAAASVSIGIPAFLLLRKSAGAFWGLIFTAGLLLSGYPVEMLAWGGYPQLIAQALVLLTLYSLGTYVIENDRWFLWLGAIAGGLTLGTSTIAGGFLAVVAPIYLLLLGVDERINLRHLLFRSVTWGVLVVVFSLPLIPIYLSTWDTGAGQQWNPQGFTAPAAFATFSVTMHELPALIQNPPVLLILGLAPVIYSVWRRGPGTMLAASSGSLVLCSLIGLVLTQEVRVLSFFEVGFILALALVLADLERAFRSSPWPVAVRWSGRCAVVIIALAFLTGALVNGHKHTLNALIWYRMLDEDTVRSLDWLRDNSSPPAVAVASENPKQFNYAWWIEGYSGIPTYSGSDPRWLIFKLQKEQTAVAHVVLYSTSSETIADLAQRHNIRHVFIDTRVIKDRTALLAAGFTPSFESGALVILTLPSGSSEPGVVPQSDGGGLPQQPDSAALRPAGSSEWRAH